MIYFAVIDTNVIVSALLKEGSIPWKILNFVIERKIIPIYNDEIIQEYEDVLTRNKFGFTKEKVDLTISLIKDYGQKMDPIEIKERFLDKDDAKFYQIVLSSQTFHETYLVTGNIKHFPKKEFVVTPSEMLEIINSQDQEP